MHNGVVRASSRLVLVWTSISLAAVAVGWAGLSSAIDTGTTEPAEVAALDPSILAPKQAVKAPPRAPAGLPTATSSPSKAAQQVSRPGAQPRRTGPASPTVPSQPRRNPARPTPTVGPTGSTGEDEITAPPAAPTLEYDVVRDVSTAGGTARIGFSDGRVYLLAYDPRPGFETQDVRTSDDSIELRFAAARHVSTLHAYVDSARSYRVSVVEEGA
jgi:hypothetical protein